VVSCAARGCSGRGSVSCSATKKMEVAHVTDSRAARSEPTLGERLRLGSLLEDGLSYKESFVIRCYEVGVNKTATVETFANLLQVKCA
jgi:fatty acyl-ACP thioesterase A